MGKGSRHFLVRLHMKKKEIGEGEETETLSETDNWMHSESHRYDFKMCCTRRIHPRYLMRLLNLDVTHRCYRKFVEMTHRQPAV